MRLEEENQEKKKQLDDMREKLKNPLFRAANEQLAKRMERELKEEEAVERVRDYLRDENPGASFAQVIMDTKVEMRILEQLIADGRINIKVTDKDWETLEEEQKELLNQLHQAGKLLKEKKEEALKQLEKDNPPVKGTGMHSKMNKMINKDD